MKQAFIRNAILKIKCKGRISPDINAVCVFARNLLNNKQMFELVIFGKSHETLSCSYYLLLRLLQSEAFVRSCLSKK